MPRVDLFRVGGQFTEGVVVDGDPKTGDSVKVPQRGIEIGKINSKKIGQISIYFPMGRD